MGLTERAKRAAEEADRIRDAEVRGWMERWRAFLIRLHEYREEDWRTEAEETRSRIRWVLSAVDIGPDEGAKLGIPSFVWDERQPGAEEME